MEICIEIREFIWEYVGFRSNAKLIISILFLHINNIHAQPILPRDLIRMQKMIHSLMLVQAFIDVRLRTTVHPKDVPIMRFCLMEAGIL